MSGPAEGGYGAPRDVSGKVTVRGTRTGTARTGAGHFTGEDGSDPISMSVAASPLATLPRRDRARLLAGAWKVTLDAGAVVPPVTEEDRHLDLVADGALMVSAGRSYDERVVVVRYCRLGDLVGVSSLFGAKSGEAVETQALVASLLLRLRPSAVIAAASSSMRVARLMLDEQSQYARDLVEAMQEAVSASVSQRVAHHLLELASAVGPPWPAMAPVRIPVTQQALAQATGTAREVVVRTLRGLRADGVVATDRDGVVVVDARRLAAAAGVGGIRSLTATPAPRSHGQSGRRARPAPFSPRPGAPEDEAT